MEKISAKNSRRQKPQASGQSVHPVDQIKGVDDYDDRKISQQKTEHFRKLIDTQKPIHAPDLDISIINDDERRQHLADKFLDRGDYEDIVFQSKEEDDQACPNKVLKFSSFIKMHR